VQLLNCTKGHATTISALFAFASNPISLVILLQEPAIEHKKLPPSHPDFHLLTPVPEQPHCATYICRSPGVQADIIFTHSDSFLGIRISFPTGPAFTIYNFYSPGRPHVMADLLPQFYPSLLSQISDDMLLGAIAASLGIWITRVMITICYLVIRN
jgi:hypothetical protein